MPGLYEFNRHTETLYHTASAKKKVHDLLLLPSENPACDNQFVGLMTLMIPKDAKSFKGQPLLIKTIQKQITKDSLSARE